MPAVIAVTGATGFIGRALCETLATDPDAQLRALVRRKAHGLPPAVHPVIGDLSDRSALEALTAEADVVVHCAGATRGRNQDDFDRVNVDGTARLLAAAAMQPRPPRIVHLSSLAARSPWLSHYALSKARAEQCHDQYPGTWTILRPTAVYGPGDQELRPLLRLMAQGLGPVPRGTAMRVTLIHVVDLVAAIQAAASTRQLAGIHELGDARTEGYGWTDLHAAMQALTGRRVYRIPVPLRLLQLAGHLNAASAGLFRYAPMLSPGKVRELTHPDWQTHPDDFMAATGWSPRIDLATGLRTVLESA